MSEFPLEDMLRREPTLQEKLHEERIELSSKIQRLKTFITMDSKFKQLDYGHRRLLQDQLVSMNHYESVLVERLMLLNQPNNN
jgi:hypothetical protein